MMKRFFRIFILFALLTGLLACVPINEPTPSPTVIPSISSLTPSPLPPTPTPTITPLGCLTQPGRLEQGTVQETVPPQVFLIYLPPCYEEMTEMHYPVLYLLHGQTYTEDQWVRLGAVEITDRLILSGEADPFIIVFPDDRYWNVQAGPGFGKRLVEHLIPYIDENYRTIDDRDYRAIGGLSRGAGWSIRLGLQQWELFGTLGLHSPAVFSDDRSFVGGWILAIPPESRPNIFIDMGEDDTELGFNLKLEEILTQLGILHEWHLYPGAHDEAYWSEHVEEYLRWYTNVWSAQELKEQ